MNRNFVINDEMLVRYLAGETTRQEAEEVQSWADSDPENARKLADFKAIWEAETPAQALADFDTHAAWSRISGRLGPRSIAQALRFNGKRILTIAATVTLLAVGAWFAWDLLREQEEEWLSISPAQIDSVLLSDGSRVVVKAGSKLEYPPEFGRRERSVKVQGMAYFTIAPDPDKPFIVNIADEVTVKVLGTRFKVNHSDSLISVWVKSGKVEMQALSGHVTLVAGEEGRYFTDKHLLVRQRKHETNEMAFIQGRLKFNNTPLHDVVRDLSEWYKADIHVAHSAVGRCRLTTTFKDEDLETALAIICATLNLKHVKSGNTIILEGAGCQ
jgi:transmembrane sensor